MKVLVTYRSKTGFTQQYARWIAQALDCEAMPDRQVKDLSGYDLVIHGGWLMGGMVSGLEQLRKRSPGKLVVFGVGFTQDLGYAATVVEANRLQGLPAFYFPGGMNPAKLNWFQRAIVRGVTKQPLEFADHTDRTAIEPLLALVRQMQTEGV